MQTKVITRVTRTVTVEFTSEQIEEILRKECGFKASARVEFDCRQEFLTGATVYYTTVEEA